MLVLNCSLLNRGYILMNVLKALALIASMCSIHVRSSGYSLHRLLSLKCFCKLLWCLLALCNTRISFYTEFRLVMINRIKSQSVIMPPHLLLKAKLSLCLTN
jgi:hypothetical protein